MKIRKGFISNSSSCSFIVDMGRPIHNAKDFTEAMSKVDLTEPINRLKTDRSSFLSFLYKNQKACREALNDYWIDNYSPGGKASDVEFVEKVDKDNLSYFEFGNESFWPQNYTPEEEQWSRTIEGYGLGLDIFSDFRYIWEMLH